MKLSPLKWRFVFSSLFVGAFILIGWVVAFKWANYADAGRMACTAQYCVELWRRMTPHDRLNTWFAFILAGTVVMIVYHVFGFLGVWFFKHSERARQLQAIIDKAKEPANA